MINVIMYQFVYLLQKDWSIDINSICSNNFQHFIRRFDREIDQNVDKTFKFCINYSNLPNNFALHFPTSFISCYQGWCGRESQRHYHHIWSGFVYYYIVIPFHCAYLKIVNKVWLKLLNNNNNNLFIYQFLFLCGAG